jgi:hypothetical protein
MNIKRWTVCLYGHDWAPIPYSEVEGSGKVYGDTGKFLRCLQCGTACDLRLTNLPGSVNRKGRLLRY